jgi:hypothetical protein
MNKLINRRGFTMPVFLLCLVLCAATAIAQDEPAENAWPREMDGAQGEITMYQPQFESYSGNTLIARAAISVKPKGQQEVVFGAIWFEARMSTDLDARLIYCEELDVTAAKFPTVEDSQVEQLTTYLEAELPQWELEIDLDRFLASVEELEKSSSSEAINVDPPEIILATTPSVLVLIDGDPILASLEGYDLEYVANTPYFIAKEPKSSQYYLKGGAYWYTTTNLTGEWVPAEKLPDEIQKVAKDIAKEEKQQAEQQEQEEETADNEPVESGPPTIVVRTTAAELIQTDGDPNFVPLDGTQVLYVENTETDILMDMATQEYFVLLSGRWYKSKSLETKGWSSVRPDDVPADFANIDAESDMGQVRASVPGTVESREAILENQIPQTAEIDRKTATVSITYDGDPKFETCAATVAYAVNTDKAVFLINGTYYCCDAAIWFVATGPSGPWQVATSVPPEIQDIPPDCPHYNVKYVYIYNSTPEVVYIGYTPGYTCSYVYYGTVVYGTGYWYQPWYHHYYYPRPVTYGFRAHWNPVTGWGFSYGMSVGWLHISVGRPMYGGWWGPAGYRHGYRHGYGHGYNHGYHHGARAGYRAGYNAGKKSPNRNVYANNRAGVKNTQNRAAKTQPARGGTNQARSGTSQKKTPKTTNKKNDVYADKNGDVYKKRGNDWQKNDKSGWSDSKGSGSTQPNLNKSQQSRQRGNQNSSQRQSSGARRSGGGGKRR